MITYKGNNKGINIVEREESYTSKASFLDMDNIPSFNTKKDEQPIFSGKRIKRGLYQSKEKLLLNADVNGASNILRKEYKEAFNKIEDFTYLMNVKVLNIQKRKTKKRKKKNNKCKPNVAKLWCIRVLNKKIKLV